MVVLSFQGVLQFEGHLIFFLKAYLSLREIKSLLYFASFILIHVDILYKLMFFSHKILLFYFRYLESFGGKPYFIDIGRYNYDPSSWWFVYFFLYSDPFCNVGKLINSLYDPYHGILFSFLYPYSWLLFSRFLLLYIINVLKFPEGLRFTFNDQYIIINTI